MGRLSIVALLALPVVELVVLMRLADEVGWGNALLATVASLVAVLTLVRMLRDQATRRMSQASDPAAMARAGFDVACLFVAETLAWFPGLASDVLAVLLALPPVRALLRRVLADRLRVPGPGAGGPRVWWTAGGAWRPAGPGPGGRPGPAPRPDPGVIDVEAVDVTPRDDRALPPGKDEGGT